MRKLEHAVILVLLLLATGAGQAFFSDPKALVTGEGQPITQIVFAALYLAVILFLVKYRTQTIRLIVREKWLAAICLWALASVLWSVESDESLRRALALIGTSIAGLYIGLHYEPKQQLKLMSFVLGVGAVGSVLVLLFFPSVGFQPDGSAQGVYNLKNSLGRMMTLGCFCFILQALSEQRRRLLRVGMFVLCFVLLILSKSATAIVVTTLMLAMLPLRKLLYLNSRKLLASFAILIPVTAGIVFWAVESSEELLGALGRQSDLTGRVPLWRLVMKSIAVHPLRGYGFTAFWDGWEGHRVSDSVNWDVAVPHAHNGFLEVWLGLGLVGLGMILILMARDFVRAVRTARSRREAEYSWPLLLVVFTVLYNLTENSLLAVNSLPWMAYGAVSYWMARTARQEQLERVTELETERQPVFSA